MSKKAETPKKKWAVEVGEYRANPKRYTQRDGLRKAQLEMAIAERYEPDDRDQALEMLHLNNSFPLLRYGIEEAEGFELPLEEEVYWELPVEFVHELSETIREVNPQYAVPFVALQKAMLESLKMEPPKTEQSNT